MTDSPPGPRAQSGQEHWDAIYTRKGEDDVTWFEPRAAVSLDLIQRCSPTRDANLDVTRDASVIDVGGGASRLVDGLLDLGFGAVTVLDISSVSLAKARERLGARAQRVRWITADVRTFAPPARYAIWHDRAVFHFLTSPADRRAYVGALERALADGGHAIMGAFAPDGPERCSGLEVVRYDGHALAEALGPSFELIEAVRHEHVTPAGAVQPFTFGRFARARARERGHA